MRKRMQRAAVLVMVFCLLIMGSRVGADAKVIRAKASGKAVNENSQMIIDYSNISKGYVMVKYKQSTKVRLKAQVACPTGITYTYNLYIPICPVTAMRRLVPRVSRLNWMILGLRF